MKTTSHEEKSKRQLQTEAQNSSIVARNREIGQKIGSLAYFFFYHKLSFLLFEEFLPLLMLNNIDIGQINHSEKFLWRLIDPCYIELQKQLRTYLNQIVPCTDFPRPVTLLADKGTIKHDTSQVTLIKTICLKKGILFATFFV